MKLESKYLVITVCLIVIFASCRKQEGTGGTSSISGNIIADVIFDNKNGDTLGTNQKLANANVYICYGTDSIPADNIKTNYDGSFRFDYLQKGTYTLYVLSDNIVPSTPYPSTNFQLYTIVKKQIEITGKNKNVDAGTFHMNYGY